MIGEDLGTKLRIMGKNFEVWEGIIGSIIPTIRSNLAGYRWYFSKCNYKCVDGWFVQYLVTHIILLY